MPGGSPTLRICEIGGRARLGFEGSGHVEEPTLQEAADALVANMVRIAAAVYSGGVGPASTEVAPDLTALDFIWKLGEHVDPVGEPARGGADLLSGGPPAVSHVHDISRYPDPIRGLC